MYNALQVGWQRSMFQAGNCEHAKVAVVTYHTTGSRHTNKLAKSKNHGLSTILWLLDNSTYTCFQVRCPQKRGACGQFLMQSRVHASILVGQQSLQNPKTVTGHAQCNTVATEHAQCNIVATSQKSAENLRMHMIPVL
jgi:hypothetical protein